MRLTFLRPATFIIMLSLSACAPKALYFHESTKVAFAADYNTSDTQPLSTSFGYKRRIVAIVPAQERVIPSGGTERNGTNTGEALSLVSKFNVRAGRSEGVVITNNFASGMAARIMTRSVGSPDSLNVLMHSAPISVTAATGETSNGKPATQVVNERLARIMSKRTTDVPASRRTVELDGNGNAVLKRRPSDVPPSTRTIDLDENGNIKNSGQMPREVISPIGTPPRGQPSAAGGKPSPPLPDLPLKKTDVPPSTRSVDLTPNGGAEIKKR